MRGREDIPIDERARMFSNHFVDRIGGGDGEDTEVLIMMATWISSEQGAMDNEPVSSWLPEARAALYAYRLFQHQKDNPNA